MQNVEFTFSKEWTHAGVARKSGDKLSMPEDKARKLKGMGAGSYTEPDRKKPSDEPDETPRKRGFLSAK